jgi:hypothetical protein
MPRLQVIDGQFIIQISGAVETLEFPRLVAINSVFLLPANPALRTVSFPALRTAGGLSIYDSPLERVTAPQLMFAQSLLIAGPAYVLDFGALEEVTGSLALLKLAAPDLSAFSSLVAAQQLEIDDTTQLRDLGALTRLRLVSSIGLRGNAALSSLSGLEQVTQLESLVVNSSAALGSLSGLQNLTSVGSLVFDSDPALTELSLPALLSVNESFLVARMPALAGLGGLDPLRVLRGQVVIDDNARLTPEQIAAFLARFR